MRKETTRFQNVLLVLGKWTTIKFKHCLPGCHSLRSCTDYICMLTYSSAVLLHYSVIKQVSLSTDLGLFQMSCYCHAELN